MRSRREPRRDRGQRNATVYLENQYLASRKLANAIAARLQEPDGPEVVIVLPRNSESRIEEHAMDEQPTFHMLWEADEYDRLGVYWPVTDGGEPIYVQSCPFATIGFPHRLMI